MTKKLTEAAAFRLADTVGFNVPKFDPDFAEERRLAIRLLRAKRVVKFFDRPEEFTLFSNAKAKEYLQMELKDERPIHSASKGT